MEKLIIYKSMNTLYVTNEENYRARIQNARAIHRMEDFETPQEIIEYYCKYFGSKPEDFIDKTEEE